MKQELTDSAEIARRIRAVSERKRSLGQVELTPEQLDEVLDPVQCFRERKRQAKRAARKAAAKEAKA